MSRHITAKRARELLDYDPETGALVWKVSGRRISIGKIAGGIGTNGYRRLTVDGVTVLAHRLIWLHFYGRWPDAQIDHVNGNPLDNRIANLRAATQAQNVRNARRRSDGTNMKGVVFDATTGRWRAKINVNGKSVHLGRFETEALAHAAYKDAALKLHGDFARVQ